MQNLVEKCLKCLRTWFQNARGIVPATNGTEPMLECSSSAEGYVGSASSLPLEYTVVYNIL